MVSVSLAALIGRKTDKYRMVPSEESFREWSGKVDKVNGLQLTYYPQGGALANSEYLPRIPSCIISIGKLAISIC